MATVSVSPGKYRHQGVIDVYGTDFVTAFERAERGVREGRSDSLSVPGLPWGSMWSAGAFVDCFNPDNRYSVTHHAANLSHVEVQIITDAYQGCEPVLHETINAWLSRLEP